MTQKPRKRRPPPNKAGQKSATRQGPQVSPARTTRPRQTGPGMIWQLILVHLRNLGTILVNAPRVLRILWTIRFDPRMPAGPQRSLAGEKRLGDAEPRGHHARATREVMAVLEAKRLFRPK